MFKKLTFILISISALQAMDREYLDTARVFDVEAQSGAVGDVQRYFEEQKTLHARIRKQIALVRSNTQTDACTAGAIGCNVFGYLQQFMGFDPRAAYTTSLVTLLYSLTMQGVQEDCDDQLPTSLHQLRELETTVATRITILQRLPLSRGSISDGHVAHTGSLGDFSSSQMYRRKSAHKCD